MTKGFQNKEKEKRAAELVIANKELAFQNKEKEKRAANLLLDSEEKFRTLYESSSDAIMMLDESGFFDCNQATLHLFGCPTRGDFISKHPSQLSPPNQPGGEASMRLANEHVATAFKNGSNRFEWMHCQLDGSEFPAEVLLTKMELGGKAVLQAIVRNITERKNAEHDLHESLQGTITAISKAVEARDPYTAGHERRVADISCAIAKEMGLDEYQIEGIRMGATIHDIGKIQIPAEILSKPAKLTEMEYRLIQAHAATGYDILKDIKFPWPIAEIVYQHHERIDGTGYPQGLKGEEICLEARIVAVADVVEAISSRRPYRAALGIEAALDEIKANRGILYDPVSVDACLKAHEKKKFSV